MRTPHTLPVADVATEAAATPRGMSVRSRLNIAQLAVYAGITLALAPILFTPALAIQLIPAAVIFAAGLGTLWVRRSRPTVALVGALVLLPLSFWLGMLAPEVALLAFVLYESVIDRPAREVWTRCAAGVLAALTASIAVALRFHYGPSVFGSETDNMYTDAPRMDLLLGTFSGFSIPGVLGIIVIVLLGVNVGHRRSLARSRDAAQEGERRDRELQLNIVRAEERERIAREMHDIIAHSLAVMIAVADGARAIALRDPAESQEAIGRVADTGRRTLTEVRGLLGAVASAGDSPVSETAPQPGVGQLPTLVEEFRTAGVPVRLNISGAPPADAGRELAIYRVVQESLTNVLRHARETTDVLVEVRVSPAATTILVEDTSAPAMRSDNPGRGLLGMHERAAMYGGSAESGPRPGGGWRVKVRLSGKE